MSQAPELRPLVLKSSQWLRGKYADDGSGLYVRSKNRKHQYCCLGVLSKACGIAPRKMVGVGAPDELLYDDYGDRDRNDLPEGVRWCVTKDGGCSRDANLAVTFNDDSEIDDATRVRKLKPIFRRHGWDLQFVDDEGGK